MFAEVDGMERCVVATGNQVSNPSRSKIAAFSKSRWSVAMSILYLLDLQRMVFTLDLGHLMSPAQHPEMSQEFWTTDNFKPTRQRSSKL
ncbi:hypothetical protein ABKN59_010310 [Abortiporus biennis]